MPSQYLGLSKEEIDPECERAFILASMQIEEEQRKKAEKKAKANARRRR